MHDIKCITRTRYKPAGLNKLIDDNIIQYLSCSPKYIFANLNLDPENSLNKSGSIKVLFCKFII